MSRNKMNLSTTPENQLFLNNTPRKKIDLDSPYNFGVLSPLLNINNILNEENAKSCNRFHFMFYLN